MAIPAKNYSKQFETISEEMNSINESNVYHYTNFTALESILRERQLWFTHYRYLNDPSELILANSVIKKTIDAFLKTKNTRFWTFFSEKYPEILNSTSVYIISFCKKPDHLPAWRWYGDNGMGYAIGFNKFNFEKSEIQNNNPKIDPLNVMYNEEDFSSVIKKFLSIANQQRNGNDNHDVDLLTSLGSNLFTLSPGFKHSGYKTEEEFRLYQAELLRDGTYYPHEIPHKFNSPKSKQTEDHQKPCMKIDNIGNESETPRAKSNKFSHNDICEIWVGPCLDFECAKKRIQNILKDAGYDTSKIAIKKSQAFYRG